MIAQRTLNILSLSACALLLTGCVIGGANYRESRTLSVIQEDVAPVHVHTKNGAVSVVRADIYEVQIDARIKARTQERLDETEIFARTLADGTLDIGVSWPGGRRYGNEGVSFEIRVPDAEGVNVRTGNGSIKIEGLSGVAELDTSNGRIYVHDHYGPIDARTSNGRIIISDATDEVVANTSNGRVEVTLASDNPGPVQIDTSNGSVLLRVGAAFEGRLVMDTSNGRIRLNDAPPVKIDTLRRTYASLIFGDDVHDSRVDTSNGSITVEFGG